MKFKFDEQTHADTLLPTAVVHWWRVPHDTHTAAGSSIRRMRNNETKVVERR